MAQHSDGHADLAEQIKAIQAEMLALTEQIRSFSSAKAQAGADAMRDAAGAAGESMRAGAEEARRHGERVAADLEGRITASPLPSVLIAAGVGLVIGALFARR